MSRLIPAVFAPLITPTTLLFAQGRVNFNNFDAGRFPMYPIWTTDYQSRSNNVGSDFSMQLRWAARTFTNQFEFDAANPAASVPVSFLGTTGSDPLVYGSGGFDGGTIAIGPVGTYTM